MSPKRRSPRPRVDPQQARALEWIRAGRDALKAAEYHVAQGVALARHCGLSYQRIGQELGVTGEAVRQRFGGDISSMLARYAPPRDPGLDEQLDDDDLVELFEVEDS